MHTFSKLFGRDTSRCVCTAQRLRSFTAAPPPSFEEDDMQISKHKQLYEHYDRLLGNPILSNMHINNSVVLEIEREWLNEIELKLGQRSNFLNPVNFPLKKNDFVDWFDEVVLVHQDMESQLFNFLQNDANETELGLYICLEDLVDAKFDDIIAISQIGVQNVQSKMALGSNYWDEMGNGNVLSMHGPMFNKCCQWFKENTFNSYTQEFLTNEMLNNWKCLQNSNLLLCYAANRQFGARLFGAITILEETAHPRFEMLVKAMDRLNIPQDVSKYQRLHATLDEKHGRELVYDVCIPLINDSFKYSEKIGKNFIKQICLGVATRVEIANDYYNGIDNILKNYQKCIDKMKSV